MKEKLLEIINHYGVNTKVELLKYMNKLAEDQDEKPIWTIEEYYKYIEEELADVYVMLNQLFYYYGLNEKNVSEIMRNKVDRQLDRIKKEEEK